MGSCMCKCKKYFKKDNNSSRGSIASNVTEIVRDSCEDDASSAASRAGAESLSDNDIQRIIYEGDLVGIKTIIEKNRFDEHSKHFADIVKRGDGAAVRRLLDSPVSGKVALYLLQHPLNDDGDYWMHKTKNNPILFKHIMKTLMRVVTSEHEGFITELLKQAIKDGGKSDVLTIIDQLWIDSLRKKRISQTKTCNQLFQFYRSLKRETSDDHCSQNEKVVTVALQIGIPRHINAIIHEHPNMFEAITKEPSSDIKVFLSRYIINSKDKVYSDIDTSAFTEELIAFKEQRTKLKKFFSSGISENSSIFNQKQEFYFSTVLEEMENLSKQLDNQQSESICVLKSMKWLFKKLFEKHRNSTPLSTPILVGSSKEGTQCFSMLEFDILLHLPHKTSTDELCNEIRAALLKFNSHPGKDARLILEGFVLSHEGKYPCLHITWAGQVYKDMPISVDLVPVTSTNKFYRYREDVYKTQVHVWSGSRSTTPSNNQITRPKPAPVPQPLHRQAQSLSLLALLFNHTKMIMVALYSHNTKTLS